MTPDDWIVLALLGTVFGVAEISLVLRWPRFLYRRRHHP